MLYRILRIPKVESVMYGSIASKRGMLIFLRKSLMQAPMRLSRMVRKSERMVGEMGDFRILRNSRLIVFQRSGELPMRKDALRFCDDAIKFLG